MKLKQYSVVIFTLLTILLLSACSTREVVHQVNTLSAVKHEAQNVANTAKTSSTTSANTNGTATTATNTLNGLQAHYINVGQGDSIYIHDSKGDNILIDGGKPEEGKTVVAYLKSHGVQTLDAIISTHPDSDHMGGLTEVVNDIPVIKAVYAPKVTHNTLTYEHFLQAVKNKGIQIQTAKTGVTLPLQDPMAQAKFLAPVRTYSTEDTNDWSGVLFIQYGAKTFLFTGDAEFPSENDMMAQHLLPHIDVLKVSHHGANSATSSAFLNTIKPEYAIISVGLHNIYGHPTQPTLDRLQAVHAKIYRTDLQGTIIASTDGTNINIQTER